MDVGNKDVRLRVDGYTRVCLTAIAVLLTLLVIGLWADMPVGHDRRAAGAEAFLDAITQRKMILEVQKTTNTKLEELIRLFRDGKAKVQLAEAPAKGAGSRKIGNVVPKKTRTK
ncbi:MAG: hypothetical protein QF577_06865 [Phycisphaerae bacterium]|jgi:hypothetical protein|nr:hypothetical protein [Phycisphaerae bacterium]MDP7637251.1 hypothetical protein [Phycisphaerae bacterium]